MAGFPNLAVGSSPSLRRFGDLSKPRPTRGLAKAINLPPVDGLDDLAEPVNADSVIPTLARIEDEWIKQRRLRQGA